MAGMVAALAAWLWPIGFGGAMPVGGDVTAFSLGLMGRLRRAMHTFEWPVWLDDWGFGFPGIAESQLGYYYPPHWLFYGLLPLEAAYTANLVSHLLWAMVGAVWAARIFGASKRASWFAGLVFGLNGFFLVHLPHHWSYTVGSWMPWGLGLAWRLARGERPLRSGLLLGFVLAIQVLPGHFQLAFMTQVGTCVVLAAGLAGGPGRIPRRLVAMAAAAGFAIGLSACQWLPTLRLAELANRDRTYDYLSGFAGTPFHLVNYVAPLLFHRSPLWRPLVWDPFHTSPEEWQPYVGLVPLILAVAGAWKGWSSSLETRTLSLVVAIGMLLALGPYLPGFAAYSQLPGFSFFRSPARWSLLVSFGLALLSARGLDLARTGDWSRDHAALISGALVALAWPAVMLVVLEAMLADGRGGGASTSFGDLLLGWLPWNDRLSTTQLIGQMLAPRHDLAAQMGYAREGWGKLPANGVRFDQDRARTYLGELGPSLAVAAGIVVLATAGRRRGVLVPGLVLLTVVDLVLLGHFRGVESAPMRPIAEQSWVLGRMSRLPDDIQRPHPRFFSRKRTVDPLQNLPMAVGAAPVLAYRTLDLPAPRSILGLLRSPIRRGAPGRASFEARRLVGAALCVFPPTEPSPKQTLPPQELPPGVWLVADDPTLAGWMYGSRWVELYGPGTARFTLWMPDDPGSVDWSVERPSPPIASGTTALLQWFELAEPVKGQWGGDRKVLYPNSSARSILRTRTFEPGWRSAAIDGDQSIELSVVPVAGGWQSVSPPDGLGADAFVEFDYPSKFEIRGLLATAASIPLWILAMVVNLAGPRGPQRRLSLTSVGSHE